MIRKCANISIFNKRIKKLAKEWYEKSVINNFETKEII